MKKRILTAMIALIIFVPLVIYGGLPFICLIYLMATVGLYELLRMRTPSQSKPVVSFSLSFLLLWLLLAPSDSIPLFSYAYTKTDIILFFSFVFLIYTVISKNKFSFMDAGFHLISSIYIGFGFHYLMMTRIEGLPYILFALFIVWATDTGAYFFGNAFGKRKLWPEISPNKTIEGAVGGTVLAILIAMIFQWVFPFALSFGTIVLIALLISLIGQIGDLVASALKRHFNVKDSGTILPGHGGIIDRMDSLIFVSPFLHFIQFIT